MSNHNNINNNNNNSSGIFISQSSSERQDLQQPSTKRQRIDEQNPSKALKSAFLDDSGNSTSSTSSSPSPVANERELSENECLSAFQTQLIENQCLCELSEKVLKFPFQYYSKSTSRNPVNSKDECDNINKVSIKNKIQNSNSSNSSCSSEVHIHYVKNLKQWPEEFLLKFLSNIQLLFHVYLKQNAKGNICGKIMEICDCLIRNEITIFENLIELCNGSCKCSNFISLTASKIITYFLIIIKDEIDQEWLKKIVDNLFSFDRLDYAAVRRINFSLDIIKCIVEWKDHDEHILEEEDLQNAAASSSSGHHAPPIETNYFATYHHDVIGASSSSSSASSALPSYLIASTSTSAAATSHHHHNNHNQNSGRSSATSGIKFYLFLIWKKLKFFLKYRSSFTNPNKWLSFCSID